MIYTLCVPYLYKFLFNIYIYKGNVNKTNVNGKITLTK